MGRLGRRRDRRGRQLLPQRLYQIDFDEAPPFTDRLTFAAERDGAACALAAVSEGPAPPPPNTQLSRTPSESPTQGGEVGHCCSKAHSRVPARTRKRRRRSPRGIVRQRQRRGRAMSRRPLHDVVELRLTSQRRLCALLRVGQQGSCPHRALESQYPGRSTAPLRADGPIGPVSYPSGTAVDHAFAYLLAALCR